MFHRLICFFVGHTPEDKTENDGWFIFCKRCSEVMNK